jgi:hypothetical protein
VGIKVQNFQALIDSNYTHTVNDERAKSVDPIYNKEDHSKELTQKMVSLNL